MTANNHKGIETTTGIMIDGEFQSTAVLRKKGDHGTKEKTKESKEPELPSRVFEKSAHCTPMKVSL